MSTATLTAIELDKLPAPEVVEPLSFEIIVDEMLLNFRNAQPDYDQITESDPVYILLEQAAYRELTLRQRINDAARDVMLAFAQGHNLDHLGAYFGVKRKIIQEAVDDPISPIPEILEDDERFKLRIQLSVEALTTAGSIGSYKFHGLSASPKVKDISVTSPAPGDVVITVLSTEADGVADDELLNLVDATLNADDVRPLTDHVIVQNAAITSYALEADLYFYPGPDPKVALQAAETATLAYVRQHHRLGHDIPHSGLYNSLHQEGVQRVEILQPIASLVIDAHQSAFCLKITLNNKGTDV